MTEGSQTQECEHDWRDIDGRWLCIDCRAEKPYATETQLSESDLAKDYVRVMAERDRYRAALRKIALLHPWVANSHDAAMKEARRALGV